MCLKILRISLVILAGWALSTASLEPGWTRKRSLAQRGHLSQVLSEGERCWLGAKLRRPRAAPQNHLFGVYPSRPGDHLRPYPVGGQGSPQAGHSKPDATGGMAMSPAGSVGLRGEAEQPATLWARHGSNRWSELQGDNDTYLGDRRSKEIPGEAETQERSAMDATIRGPKEPQPESRRKGRAKTRHRRQAVKGQAGGMLGDPGVSPWHFQSWPKHPLVHGVRTSLAEDSIQKNGGDPSREAETFNPHGGLPVLYFSGRRGRLLLRPEVLAAIPREAFTVEAWVRPEGGQNNPAIIAGNGPLLGFLWSLGVQLALLLPGLDIGGRGEEGDRGRRARRCWPGREGGRAFIHQHSRTPDINYDNDSLTTRAFVPMSIDLMWFYTSCLHLGDLQLDPYPSLKGKIFGLLSVGKRCHAPFLVVQSERPGQL